VLKSFLTGRSQQVRCGSLSSEANVTCGVVQGNVLGPNLFAMYLDSLLTQLSVPAPAFADGLKLLVNLSTHGVALAQANIDLVTKLVEVHGHAVVSMQSFRVPLWCQQSGNVYNCGNASCNPFCEH
jgi:hypothetical protein